MSSTQYTDGVTLVSASWLNDLDTAGYSGLTAVAGQNTITATGPVTLSAYAANQIFRFTPVSSNTVSTTLNISAIGAKNIFYAGAALSGGELKAGVPAVVIYDGTQFNLVSKGVNDNSPSFQAYTSTGASMPTTNFTLIPFNVKEFDDNTNFNVTTSRFVPTVPGKYHVDIVATLSAINAQKYWLVALFKNGALYKQGTTCVNGTGAAGELTASIAANVSMNGSTDYIEAYGYNSDVSQTISTTSTKALFGAYRVTA